MTYPAGHYRFDAASGFWRSGSILGPYVAPIAPTQPSSALSMTGSVLSSPVAPNPGGNPRDALVYGTYKPDATTVGPLPGTVFTTLGTGPTFDGSGNQIGNGTQVDFNVTANGQVVQNLYVWGDINLGSFSNVIVRNCVIRGGLTRGSDKSYIYGQGDDLRGANIVDCRIEGRPVLAPATYNGQPVTDAGYVSVTNEWRGEALRGGNVRVERCEVLRTADGFDLTGVVGNWQIYGNWIHSAGYNEWTTADGPSPGNGYYIPAALGSLYTHSDTIQFSRGKHVRIIGNRLGGAPTGIWNHNAGHRADIVAGDDYYNSCFMVKQEVDSSLANQIQDVVIAYNWLSGGIASVNFPSSSNGNPWPKRLAQDNYSLTDMSVGANDPGIGIWHNKYTRSTWGTGQLYNLVYPSWNDRFVDNTFEDDGSAVPFTRGS